MSVDAAEQELERLLQFFYQCPVGLLELDDAGTVTMINPAAARMLAPAFGSLDPTSFFPVLDQLAPELTDLVRGDLDRLGPLAGGRRILLPAGPHSEQCLELLLVRVEPGRVMVTLVDVSEERRLAQREHEIIVGLQKSMLGRIDTVPGLAVGVTYRVAEVERQIGGDWYDLVDLPDDRVGLVVGDVVGHNLGAAAAMGQLRSALRSLALVYLDPGELLQHCDAFAAQVEDAACTTVTYAVLERTTGRLTYASAGHPPALLVRADGSADFLWGGRERPLVCLDQVERASATALLADGDTLVLYTDGLIERRTADLDDGLDRLRAAAMALHDLDADELCQQLVATMLSDGPPDDDVCVLVVRHARLLRLDDPAPGQVASAGSRAPELPRARTGAAGERTP